MEINQQYQMMLYLNVYNFVMWFLHDEAPPHFSLRVRNHLNRHYPERWIGRGSSVSWSPRSSDLTPLDFYLWGYLKNVVYQTPVNNEEDMGTCARCLQNDP